MFSCDWSHRADARARPGVRAAAGWPRSCCGGRGTWPPHSGRAGAAGSDLGVASSSSDAAGCRTVEPGPNPATPPYAGIHLPRDEVANCRQFALLLRTQAERLGALPLPHSRCTRSAPITPSCWCTSTCRPTSPASPAGLIRRTSTRTPSRWPARPSRDLRWHCFRRAGAPLRPHGLKLPLLAVHGYRSRRQLRCACSRSSRVRPCGRGACHGRDQPARQPCRRQRRARRPLAAQEPECAGHAVQGPRRLVPGARRG